MNPIVRGGLLRHVLQFVAGILIAKGYIDENSAEQVVGAVTSLITVGWFAIAKKK